jgi:hypothetical protein
MMSIQPFLLMVLLLIMISGCRTLSGADDVPARITQPDAGSRAALQATLSELYGGIKIRLADDALTRSSLLVLTTGANSALVEPAATGRIVSEPYRFRLVRQGDDCILIDLRDDSRHLLAHTTCTPEA